MSSTSTNPFITTGEFINLSKKHRNIDIMKKSVIGTLEEMGLYNNKEYEIERFFSYGNDTSNYRLTARNKEGNIIEVFGDIINNLLTNYLYVVSYSPSKDGRTLHCSCVLYKMVKGEPEKFYIEVDYYLQFEFENTVCTSCCLRDHMNDYVKKPLKTYKNSPTISCGGHKVELEYGICQKYKLMEFYKNIFGL